MSTYDRVKERADAMGKRISHIEKDAGIANGTISGWRTGKPLAETLKKVADQLGCDMVDLMEDK